MLELTKSEAKKVEIVNKVINKEITQKEAASLLHITDRQVRRLIKLFKSEGELGFIHKNRGKVSQKKISQDLANKIVEDYLNNYSYYNFEHYYEERGFKFGISYSAMFTIFKDYEIISPIAQHKTVRLYNENMRNAIKEKTITTEQEDLFKERLEEEKARHIRKSILHFSFGEEIQMDATFWIWFGTQETALHLAVDKATNTIIDGYFDYEETTSAYMILLMNMTLNYGIPKKIKTDKRSSFSVNNAKSSKTNLNVTQFGRMCEDLEIILECSSNPLFKPNVERENGVFKNRLKAELIHNNITTIEEANKYLKEIFIPKMNKRFAHEINPNKNMMRKNTFTISELNIIISIRIKRTIDNASSIKYFNEYYLPINMETGEVTSYVKGTECIVINAYDKELYCLIEDKIYSLLKVEKLKPKTFEKPKEALKTTETKPKGHKPKDNHPWKMNMMLR